MSARQVKRYKAETVIVMSSKRWSVTPAQHDFMVKHQAHITRAKLAAMLNAEFGLNLNTEQVRSYTKRMGLKRVIRTMINNGDELQWIAKHQANTPRGELTAKFNERFGKAISVTQMNGYCRRKGLWMDDLIRNRKPIGHISRHGKFLNIKISKSEWQSLHRYIWEKHHGKKVPDGFMIVFADGDVDNVDIDNLVCVRETISVTINHTNPANTDNPDLNKAIMLTESLNAMVRDYFKSQQTKSIKKDYLCERL